MASEAHLYCKVPEQVEIFGSAPWEPERDLKAIKQDPNTGEWAFGKGKRRRLARCVVCGGKPGANIYCEGCSSAGHRYRGPYVITTARPDEPDPPEIHDGSDRTTAAVQGARRRRLRQARRRAADART